MNGKALTVAVIVGMAVGILSFSRLAVRYADFNPADAGLGYQTETTYAEIGGRRVSGWMEQVPEVRNTFRHFREEGHTVALWVGASQLHSINQPKEGDHLAVYYASERAAQRGSSLSYVQISSPNANIYDFMGFYLAMRQAGLIPDWMILGLTYDDLREEGVQAWTLEGLPEIPDELVALAGKGLANLREARERHEAPSEEAAPVERNAITGTPQERLESLIIRGMERTWSAYRYRSKVQAKLDIAVRSEIQEYINWREEGQVLPPIPKKAADWNWAALDSLIALTRHDGAKLLIYKPPHRPNMKPFVHDRAAYDGCFERLWKRCDSEGIYHLDLELIVPEQYWGLNNSGRPDVFHFQDSGHRRLGQAIDAFMGENGA